MQLWEYPYFPKNCILFLFRHKFLQYKRLPQLIQPQQPSVSDQSRSVPLEAMTFLYQKKESFLLLEKSPLPSSCLLT